MALVLVDRWRMIRRFSQELEPVIASENWAKPERRFQTVEVRMMSDIVDGMECFWCRCDGFAELLFCLLLEGRRRAEAKPARTMLELL